MSDHITSIVIVGARGRMGKALIREVIASDHHVLLGAVDRSGGPGRGQDAGRIAGSVEVGVPPHQPSTCANISGATIVGVRLDDELRRLRPTSLPQVIFSFGTAPEYDP
jgi:dihydrodipicolinate reductase